MMFPSFEEVLRFQGNKGFEVSRFQGYEVSRNQEIKFLGFRGFRVLDSRNQGFEVSRNQGYGLSIYLGLKESSS
jgi:hypothetical protein